MRLSRDDLAQLDDTYLAGLEEASLRALSVRLLADLKEAHERLEQNPSNSSRPPSSRVPWETAQGDQDGGAAPRAEGAEGGAVPEGAPPEPSAERPGEAPSAAGQARRDMAAPSAWPCTRSAIITHRCVPSAAARCRLPRRRAPPARITSST